MTLKRPEIRVVGRRIHIREQPIGIAESADVLDGDDARASRVIARGILT